MEFPNLFSPIKINKLEIRNRIVMTAMHLGYTPDGFVTDKLVDFYAARARGGAGLIIAGGCTIDDISSMVGMIDIQDDRYIPGLRRLTEAVKSEGAGIAAQLYQAGRYVHSSAIAGRKSISASAVRSKFTGETPRALEPDEIQKVQDRFAGAAVRAMEAGFDAVEILGSAGYLISQFLSPVTNLRKDEYGGSFENRMRFGLETAVKVRKAVGKDYPIIIRLAGNDFMEGGNTNREAKIFAAELEKAGIDLFDITGGWHETRVPQLTMAVPHGAYVYLAQGIKSVVSAPVLSSNRINDPFTAERILRDGSADLVTMARGLIADPELPNKALAGKSALIYRCIGCNQGCFDMVFTENPVTCTVNPATGIEGQAGLTPSADRKKILVIGGGPAGMKAACTAAERGHQVILAEKAKKLGGQLLLNRDIPGRQEMVTAAEDLISNLKDLGVEVLLEKDVDESFVKQVSPDSVIIATGARPFIPEINGLDTNSVATAWQVLDGKVNLGRKVVIVGGNAVGLEAAIHIASIGTITPETLHFLASHKAETWEVMEALITRGIKEVTVVEMLAKYGRDIGPSTRWIILDELKRLGVKIITNAKAVSVKKEGLEIEREGGPELIEADSVVIAAGARPVNDLKDRIECVVKEVHVIGDAAGPRKALDAIKEGFIMGLKI